MLNTDNKLYYFTNSANRITSTGALSSATWYHIALVRTGTNTMLFIDGAQTGSTYVDSNTYINPASRPAIGIAGNDLVSGGLNGWIDELRVSTGIARWTTTFTPPTAAYF